MNSQFLQFQNLNSAQQLLEVFEVFHNEFSEDYETEELLEIASRFLKVARGEIKKPAIKYGTENATNYSLPIDTALKSKSVFYSYCLQFVQLEQSDLDDYSRETLHKVAEIIWSVNDPAHLLSCHYEARGINS